MITFIIFLIALSILVVFHELGHFLAAKKGGVLVYEFGLGYPPRLWGKKIGETIYSLNWLPMGGFVRLLERPEEGSVKERLFLKKRALSSQPKRVRFLVVAAGVGMNLLLAVVIFSFVYSLLGIPRESDRVRVVAVAPGSPAAEKGIKEGDVIWGLIEGERKEEFSSVTQLVERIEKEKGKEITLLLAKKEKGEEEVSCPARLNDYHCFRVKIIPRVSPPEREGPLGVAVSQVEMVKPVWWQRPFLGVWAGFKEAFFWGKTIAGGVGEMIYQLLFFGRVPADVAGPVGIYQATSSIKEQAGFLAMIHFFGVLSVNFAIVNLLPLPALDGSRILFLLWEAVSRKPLPEKVERALLNFGMVLLIFLFVLITIADLKRLGVGG